ncbi:MAG TPA: hypothetical protein VND93_33305 [Myxococcales bacterium]|nr:hypothetical protein [Myxococcales bacterium]
MQTRPEMRKAMVFAALSVSFLPHRWGLLLQLLAWTGVLRSLGFAGIILSWSTTVLCGAFAGLAVNAVYRARGWNRDWPPVAVGIGSLAELMVVVGYRTFVKGLVPWVETHETSGGFGWPMPHMHMTTAAVPSLILLGAAAALVGAALDERRSARGWPARAFACAVVLCAFLDFHSAYSFLGSGVPAGSPAARW